MRVREYESPSIHLSREGCFDRILVHLGYHQLLFMDNEVVCFYTFGGSFCSWECKI